MTQILKRFSIVLVYVPNTHGFSLLYPTNAQSGNHEELTWSTKSHLDPLFIEDVGNRDWFPKVGASLLPSMA